MGIFDRIFGSDDEAPRRPSPDANANAPRSGAAGPLTDAQAIARYRYLLRTAPPDAIEAAHAEAFAQLTPEQRRTVLAELGADAPARERPADAAADDPQALARLATRAEMRRPGTMERIFGRGGAPGVGGAGGLGMGGLLGGSFMGSLAGMVVGGAIAESLFGHGFGHDANFDGADGGDSRADDTAGADATADDASGDFGAEQDFAAGDDMGGDMGGDFGDDL